ncbi:MAG: hypothetical protein M1368_12120, partial [Thaumarchaeota archaeon]|nr:hypothetical protein [Nitrososphaerota archaeon]
MAAITRAYMIFEKLDMENAKDDGQALSFWKDFWYSPDELQEYVRVKDTDEDINRLGPQVVSLYRETFPLLFGFVSSQYKKTSPLRIPL